MYVLPSCRGKGGLHFAFDFFDVKDGEGNPELFAHRLLLEGRSGIGFYDRKYVGWRRELAIEAGGE